MSAKYLIPILLALVPSITWADVEPVAIRVPETKAWTGQKASFFVELRASGTFDGSASFSLPDLDRGVIVKIGNPVVSSKEIEGDSWFVQTHEFALFSQQSGSVEIPPFEVRFASRDGFTGPVTDRKEIVPGAEIEIERPPGSDKIGFLITTESLDIDESWQPQPSPARVGDLFKRTLAQRADQMTGMALAPPPLTAPDGMRVYPGDPEISDDTERGNFVGQRSDTLTYVLQEPGTYSLPAITYVWWNPTTEELRSKTLPAVTFEVAAPKTSSETPVPSRNPTRWAWLIIMVLLVVGLIIWQRQRIARAFTTCWNAWNPPDRLAARRLLRACRRNDAADASRAWLAWASLQEPRFVPTESLHIAATDLQRYCYGRSPDHDWDGHTLARAFREQLAALRQGRGHVKDEALPPLNPTS